MNPKELNTQKIMAAIESLKLPADQLTIAEDYITGAAGEEALEKLTYKNLSSIPANDVLTTMRKLLDKKNYDDARKLFNILFAVGRNTCHNMMPSYGPSIVDGLFTKETMYKYIAVYSNRVATNEYMLYHTHISAFEKFEMDYDCLRKAIDCQKDTNNGIAFLLAIYFKRKYTDSVIDNLSTAQQTDGKPTGLLAGVGRLLGLNKNSSQIQIEKDDLPLLERYESLMINSLGSLFDSQMPASTLTEIQAAVRSDSIDKIRPLVRKNANYTKFIMKLIGGLSYLNFSLSPVLKNVVSLCFEINNEVMLNIVYDMSCTLNVSIFKIGGDFDKLFGIDSREYIIWLAGRHNTNMNDGSVFARQLQTNKDVYLDIISEGITGKDGMESVNYLLETVKTYDPKLYQEIIADRTKNGGNKDMENTADWLLNSYTSHYGAKKLNLTDDNKEKLKEYLMGRETLDAIYPFADNMAIKYFYGGNEQRLVENFRKTYGDGEFPRRCAIVETFIGGGNYLRSEMSDGQHRDISVLKVEKFFGDFEKEGLSLKYQLSVLDVISDSVYDNVWKDKFTSALRQIFTQYIKEKREETLTAFSSASALGRWFGLTVMANSPEENKQEILSYAQDGSKLVKEYLLEILYPQKGWEDDLKAMLSSKKAGERELAVRVLIHWQGEGEDADYTELFAPMLKNEKNSKVMALLQASLKVGGEGASGAAKSITQDDLVAQLHKGGKKRSLAWAYETPFSPVHKTNGEEASEEYLQAILLCYSTAEKNGISLSAASLAEALNPNELAVYVNELFDKWLAAGAEAKKRWVLYAASIHGGAEIVQKLNHQIQEWPQIARGAIAADAVGALALNPLPQALLIVDSISRKFKFKQVKAAAGAALEFAASQLGITKEELADRIVPNLGFDENMERIFDYGERKFTVTITTALEVEVFDESGKKLKNLPAVGKKDDPEKAAAAYEEFKQMKKQMKTTVSSQKSRLEFALSVKREWSIEAWNNLFVKNPIMHQFAIGLIWGIYEDGKLTQSFRYMEDGSFNTEDEEEYTLPESGQIGLVHPIEMTDASLSNWKQQLEDYEIKQPIEQLDRPVYKLTDEEKEQKSMERFGGYVLNDLSLGGKLLGMGWYRGSVQDAGGFYTYYREDIEAGLGVELHFSGSFVGGYDGGEDVTVYEARFYKAGTIERGSYCYDEVDDNKAIALKDIPPRYFSEIVLQLTKATASSEERDEDWRKDLQ